MAKTLEPLRRPEKIQTSFSDAASDAPTGLILPDKRDIVERKYLPDAMKTRDHVRSGWRDTRGHEGCTGWIDAMQMARTLVPQLSDLGNRERLESAIAQVDDALTEYCKVETSRFRAAWMGNDYGQLGAMPDRAPVHKVALADAWHNMIAVLNDLSVVGIVARKTRFLGAARAIGLISDPDNKGK